MWLSCYLIETKCSTVKASALVSSSSGWVLLKMLNIYNDKCQELPKYNVNECSTSHVNTYYVSRTEVYNTLQWHNGLILKVLEGVLKERETGPV